MSSQTGFQYIPPQVTPQIPAETLNWLTQQGTGNGMVGGAARGLNPPQATTQPQGNWFTDAVDYLKGNVNLNVHSPYGSSYDVLNNSPLPDHLTKQGPGNATGGAARGLGNLPNNTNNESSWMNREFLLGDKNSTGAIPALTSVLGTGVQGWLGYQNYQLGRDNLRQGKKEFTNNFNARAQTLNTTRNDRYASAYARASEASRANMLTPAEKAAQDNIKTI